MKLLLISIHDRAVNAFMPVANVRAPGEALRVFRDLLTDPQQPHSKHPDDYDLYSVGTFDDQTGSLEPQGPTKLADGKTIRDLAQA